MKIIISPAKGFQESSMQVLSKPKHMQRVLKIVEVLKGYDVDELQKLMGISEKLAIENKQRYENFENSKEGCALWSYDGMVYSKLELDLYQEKEISYLDEHVRILSGLYGVLLPRDGIVPYRLEAKCKLSIDGCKDLYEFYGSSLLQDVFETDDEVLWNLASGEYSKLILPYCKNHPVVSFDFIQIKDGSLHRYSSHVKQARGRMLNEMIKQQITSIEEVVKVQFDGYQFVRKVQKGNEIVLEYVKGEKLCTM